MRIEIPYSDVSSLPEKEREPAAIRVATADAQRPVRFECGPAAQAASGEAGRRRLPFSLTLHHLIFDGMTVYQVLMRELAAVYEAFSQGKPSPLPEPGLQYADYALWQERQMEEDSAARQLDYWRQTLAGGEAENSYLPADHPRPAVPTFRGGTETFRVSRGVARSRETRRR